MKKGLFLAFAIALFASKIWASSELLGINFQQKSEISELELVFDNNSVIADKFQVVEDKQILIDVKDVKASERVIRAFDTSEFSGAAVFVSAYKKPGTENDLRIAIQLRDNVRSNLKRLPNRIILEIENRFGAFTEASGKGESSFQEKIAQTERVESSKLLVPRSDSVVDILENLTLSGRKKYIGKKISFNVKNVSVEDILRFIAEASGFNIIIGNEIRDLNPLTLNMTSVPWDQALDTILGLNKLVAKKNGNILMVSTLEKATEDQRLEMEAKRLVVEEEPLVTKIFPISFSSIKDLEKIVKEYSTKVRGKISLDERTNSLIVKDTVEVIERIRKIIEVLDTQTPQVLIESKIVEVSEAFSKEIGLQNGINFGYDPVGAVGNAAPSIVGATLNSGTDAGPGFSFSSAPSTGDGARSLFGLTVTRFNRLLNLNFSLQLLENESKGKIVASPKVITQNKKKAKLTTKDSTSFVKRVTSSGGDGGNGEITFELIDAVLTLEVTPQVTNEGSISLDILIEKEQFGTRPSASAPPDKATRGVETSILVDNGSTVVLGGIYNYEELEAHSGVPFLKDIPLIGWLFRTAYAPSTRKNEMIIFLTPRIINQEEAGIVDRT
jgi:type IV pilus assembly protein PilQ